MYYRASAQGNQGKTLESPARPWYNPTTCRIRQRRISLILRRGLAAGDR